MTWHEMDPYDRHELAVTLCKTAAADGASVPAQIFQYGGETLNPHFEQLMRVRTDYVRDPNVAADYSRLGKIAGVMDTEDVVEALFLLDEASGLLHRYGTKLSDPLLCVYGQEKQASWAWSHGSDYINEDLLTNFASSPVSSVKLEDLFDEDFAVKFRKAPVASFQKMPLEQQRIVSRMALQLTSERL